MKVAVGQGEHLSDELEARAGIADRITRPATQLAALSAASLVLSVGWQLSVAALFGTSSELDSFWIALALPKAIVDSIHLGLLTILFILIFNLPKEGDATDIHGELASSVLNAVLIGTLLLVPAIMVFAPALTKAMGRGLDPEHLTEAARMLRVLALLLLPTAVAGALAGILHARRRFLPFAFGRVLSLVAQILVLFLVVVYPNWQLDALIWSTLAGYVVLMVCCVPAFRQTGFRYRPVLRWRGPQQRAIFDVALAMVAFSLLDRLNQAVDRFVASFYEAGSISALEFGWRFEIPIVQVLSMSVALPTLALMAGQAGEKQWAELRATVTESLRLLTLLVIPVIGFIVVLREPLTFLWFERGAFSPDSARLVSSLLPFMGVMFLMRAFGTVTVYGLLSLRKLRLLLSVLSVEVTLNICLNALFFPHLGLQGVVFATAISMTIGSLWIGRVLMKSLHDWSLRALAVELRRPLVASLSSVLALAALFRVFGVGWMGDTHLARGIELGTIGLAFVLGHLLIASRLRLVRLRFGAGMPQLLLRPARASDPVAESR